MGQLGCGSIAKFGARVVNCLRSQDGIVGEARLVARAFGLGPCALTEVMVLLQDRLASAEA